MICLISGLKFPIMCGTRRLLTIGDVLIRRLRLVLLDKNQGLTCAERVSKIMGKERGMDRGDEAKRTDNPFPVLC